MPPIRSIACSDDLIQFEDRQGVPRTITGAQVRLAAANIAQAEAHLNTVVIPAFVAGYQMQVHVFSLNPLRVAVGTWNAGLTIPANWWTR